MLRHPDRRALPTQIAAQQDAENAAHAAFAGKRTVTPRSRDGMIESLRVLIACRKTAVAARRVALQMIQNTIVCARDVLRTMTRMQLVRTLAAWRPDLTAYRDVLSYQFHFEMTDLIQGYKQSDCACLILAAKEFHARQHASTIAS
jgi:hypothetical protein